ncbi:sulfotransferase family 2 domain-containing protein [Cobetia sp. 1CM21F]|uniref:sulfotransferase family 2 domain-containing protein n=1 Tax=Cobetia sp. 1CM21F TaxID=2929163 RepID=UPI0020BF0CF1|nr:sulfotransferase family 2 domain-containing protein [Cobetia sp. 1CM21F]MCK8066950.1 sulfotransferase family protein [Cobetia sp. 1CM21F]
MSNIYVRIPLGIGASKSSRLATLFNFEFIDLAYSTLINRDIDYYENFTFTFVRNPFARLYHSFYHLIDIPDVLVDEETPSYLLRRKKLREKYGDSFEDFIKDKGFEKFDFSQFYPQKNWIYQSGKRVINFIGHIEDFEIHASELNSYVNNDNSSLFGTSVSDYADESLSNHISEESKRIIVNYYHDDFVNLGYGFNTSDLRPKRKVAFIETHPFLSKKIKQEFFNNIPRLGNNSPYIHVKKTDSCRDLIVVLSTHNQGEKFFGFEKLTSSHKYDLLFVTNPSNNYYLDIAPSGGNLYIDFLKEIIIDHGYHSVTLFGSSMAGYAALYIGSQLGVNVFVINPQADIELTKEYAWPSLKNTLDKISNPIDMVSSLQYSQSYIYYLSGRAPIDIANCNYLKSNIHKKNNFLFKELSDESHNFPYPDALNMLEEVHEHLSFLRKFRL